MGALAPGTPVVPTPLVYIGSFPDRNSDVVLGLCRTFLPITHTLGFARNAPYSRRPYHMHVHRAESNVWTKMTPDVFVPCSPDEYVL